MVFGFAFFIDIQQYTRQQTTTNVYSRLQTFNQQIVLDRWFSFASYKANDMKSNKYKQSVIPKAETPNEWSHLKLQQLRKLVFEYIKNKYSGTTIINIDTGLPITISVTSARKTAFGEAIYFKKAAATLLLPDLIKYAEYNNWGKPKETDGPNIIGYLNFKCKCLIDGKKEHVRLAVQFQKGGKYYYNIEINKKKAHA